jgi:hypothetical protein
MNLVRMLFVSVVLALIPGLAGCSRTPTKAQPDAKAKPVAPRVEMNKKPLLDAQEPLDMEQAVMTIKRLGGLVEMNLRDGDLVVTGVQLSGSKATDDDLKSLRAFPLLETLRLKDTAITDAGLVHLKTLARLRQVNLGGTKVSDRGVADLGQALPKLYVDRDRNPAMVKKEPLFNVANNWGDHPEIQKPIPWETATKPAAKHEVFRARVDAKNWSIRLNDFPDEPMYTLLIDGQAIIHFDNWPSFWKRPDFPK